MSCQVEFTRQAEKDLSALEPTISRRIFDKITYLSRNLENIILEPLSGKLKGNYKLRVGDWRVVYGINHSRETITIYAVDHRSRVYK